MSLYKRAGFEGRAYDFHGGEPGEVPPGRRGQFGSYLHAGDLEAAAGQREGGLAGGAPDLQEPVTGGGYRTDLMILAYEGSRVTDHGDHLVIRSPANPTYWWGNFLLLAAPPGPGETGRWLSRFAGQFPAARHVALGIDVTDSEAVDATELLAAGLHLQRSTVMTASKVHDPPHPNRGATYRQLAGDSDWRQAARLRAVCYEGLPGGDRAFIKARIAVERGLTEAGYGSWFGAFRDGQLLAQLGLIADGSGVARYRDVETHPAARRQGLAGTLVCLAARQVLATAGASTLVMVADPADNAIRVYRAVGFADAETQIGFERPPPADGSG